MITFMVNHEHALRFCRLHERGTFVLINAWDAASAAVMAAAGASAIGTTSSGVSWSFGVPDGEHLRRDDAVAMTARIVGAVDVPVNADIEAGYGPGPDDVAAATQAVIEAGAVGVNLEDRPGPDGHVLWPIELQCERLAAARAVADGQEIPFVVNARTDVFLAGVGEPADREAMVLERAERYRGAGADCLFVPGLVDIETVARLVDRCPMPINILLAPGRGATIGQLTSVGVRRISVGHAIAAAAYATAQRAAIELLAGEDNALRGGIKHPEMQALMQGLVASRSSAQVDDA